MARTIVKQDPVVKSSRELRDFIVGLDLGINPILSDQKFYFDKWERWLKAIEIDWTNANKYLTDKYDCDNFADSFNARMAEYYGWNTAGRISVALYDPLINKLIGYHRASLIITYDNGQFNAFVYDPMAGMNDEYDKIDSAIIQIKDWIYVPTIISFN